MDVEQTPAALVDRAAAARIDALKAQLERYRATEEDLSSLNRGGGVSCE